MKASVPVPNVVRAGKPFTAGSDGRGTVVGAFAGLDVDSQLVGRIAGAHWGRLAATACLLGHHDVLQCGIQMRYHSAMSKPAPLIEDDEAEGEARALAAAIAESDADPRTAPHEEVRAWLLRLALGEFDAPPPEPH